jgi:hypothetical protein
MLMEKSFLTNENYFSIQIKLDFLSTNQNFISLPTFTMTSSYPNFINKTSYSLNIDKCLKELTNIKNNNKVSIRLFENFNVFGIFYKIDKTDKLMALFVCSKLQGICK